MKKKEVIITVIAILFLLAIAICSIGIANEIIIGNMKTHAQYLNNITIANMFCAFGVITFCTTIYETEKLAIKVLKTEIKKEIEKENKKMISHRKRFLDNGSERRAGSRGYILCPASIQNKKDNLK